MKNKVILISIDGMRPDGFLQCGHPFVEQMMQKFSYTLTGSSVMPSVTLPCHTSIFYGVPPMRHGILTNTYVPPVRPVKGIAEVLANAGKVNAAFYNWETMRHVWSSETMKYTFYLDAYSEENTDAVLTGQMLELLKRKEPDFLYLYMVETDDKGGHDHGWMSKEYLAQTANAIDCVEKVFQIASEHYNIIVTADHGGHDRTHGTDCAEDMTIPMFFWGDGFAQGTRMENISLLDIAPTVASLMGVAPEKEWEGRALKTVM